MAIGKIITNQLGSFKSEAMLGTTLVHPLDAPQKLSEAQRNLLLNSVAHAGGTDLPTPLGSQSWAEETHRAPLKPSVAAPVLLGTAGATAVGARAAMTPFAHSLLTNPWVPAPLKGLAALALVGSAAIDPLSKPGSTPGAFTHNAVVASLINVFPQVTLPLTLGIVISDWVGRGFKPYSALGEPQAIPLLGRPSGSRQGSKLIYPAHLDTSGDIPGREPLGSDAIGNKPIEGRSRLQSDTQSNVLPGSSEDFSNLARPGGREHIAPPQRGENLILSTGASDDGAEKPITNAEQTTSGSKEWLFTDPNGPAFKGVTINGNYYVDAFEYMRDFFGPEYLFRGNPKSPVAIDKKNGHVFENGFRRDGSGHSDPALHIEEGGGNFVETTTDPAEAAEYPMGSTHTWVYVIKKPEGAIDKTAVLDIDGDSYDYEGHFLIPGSVSPEDIHGAQEIKWGEPVGPYIHNPNYKKK